MKSTEEHPLEEFTRQVVTSRTPRGTLNRIYRFFKKRMPVDLLPLSIFDAQHGTLHYKAFVTDDGLVQADEKIKLSSQAREAARRYLAAKVTLIPDTSRNPLSLDVIGHMALPARASTTFTLVPLDDHRYGALGLIAWGEFSQTEAHRQMVESLYVPLSGTISQILAHLEISNQRERLALENKEIRKRLAYRIIGADSGLRDVMEQVDRIASLNIPVLLTGETGVGKEVVANAIHNRSNRADGPLVSINCGAIPESLVESELFGYEKGAFTGAHTQHRGYFEQADEGTLFMDEIGELSLGTQVKLLRFLQTLELRRIGGNRTISVDVRIVAATNRDIQALVRENRFREDLWYRLNVFPIHIPPLRERKQDIPELADYFAHRQAVEMNLPYVPSFAPEAMDQLRAYDWPGNIRELKNVIERALITCQGEPLRFPHLSPRLRNGGSPARCSCSTPEGFPTLDQMIARHIREGLRLARGRIEGRGGAAELLGIHPSTLRAKMRKLGIRIERVAR